MLNTLEIQGNTLDTARITCLGEKRENLYMFDRRGMIRSGREDLNSVKEEFMNDDGARTLGVQSRKNMERDIEQNSVAPYIVAGVVALSMFILTLSGVVMLVVRYAG